MADLKLIETGSGGDIFRFGNDFLLIEGLENMPYLAMFGGNPGFVTPQNRVAAEQSFDWWGNSLLFFNEPQVQFNSETEHTLRTVALNSSGRAIIEQAILRDLAFMRLFAEITVEVTIISIDRISILVKILEPDNLQSNEFTYIWNATENELTDPDINISPPQILGSFSDGFSNGFFI